MRQQTTNPDRILQYGDCADKSIRGWQEDTTAKRRRRNDRKVVDGQTKIVSDSIEPNDNVTVPYGPVTLTRMAFDMLEMDRVLSRLKRKQGATVSEVCIALVAHAMQMRGLSINRMETVIEDADARLIYGLSDEVDKNDLYRTGKLLGDSIDPIIRHIDGILRDKLGLRFESVFMDWSATYLDGKPTRMMRFGHSKDHRPDRPQVSIGLTMDSATRLPLGITVMPGNVVDVTHFRETFKQVKPFLEKDCLIIFDNGGYSDANAKMVTSDGFDFLTRAQMNKSNDKQISSPKTEWEYLDDDMCAHTFKGNLNYTKCIYFSSQRYHDAISGYYRKANRDYDEMLEIRATIGKGKKPRKKYRNSNMFVNTWLSHQFQLDGMTREEAIEEAVRRTISGREGFFILMSSRKMTASEMLSLYRSRNDIEDAYRDMKHGIDIRPLRCKDDSSVKGRVLIAFLAYFVMALAKFLVPEMRERAAETLVPELNSFSVTHIRSEGRKGEAIYSNFSPAIRAILEAFSVISPAIPRGSRLGKGLLGRKAPN